METESLIVTDIEIGTGKEAVKGALIQVHYDGYLLNGQKFNSSRDRGRTFQFVLGSGKVIQGWDKGIMGMKVGGKRHLQIPPSLAYGDRAIGSIPPGSTLKFDVELFEVLTRDS